MPLTYFQREVCRLLAESREKNSQSYIAGGAALNELLPPEQVGKAVLSTSGNVFHGNVTELRNALQTDQLIFHDGHIGGVWPQVSS